MGCCNLLQSSSGTDTTRALQFDQVYSLGDVLGEGAFAQVKEATHNSTQVKSAVKIINKTKLTRDDAEGLKREIVILQELNHPNIMKLLDLFNEKYWIYMVTELVSAGELFDRIVQRDHYDEAEARNVSRTMFGAIKYCHDRKIAHRDLKPENILLVSRSNDSNIKIADFGFAKKCEKADSLITQCGTPGYVAPEIVTGDPYGLKADTWSLGVILYILLCGYPPFNAKNQKSLFKLIKRGLYQFHDSHWTHVSEGAKEMIAHLLLVDPEQRLSASDALRTKWMNESSETLRSLDLTPNLYELRKFNAKRKVKQAILAHIAANKMTHFVGMGVDQTFGFTQGKRFDAMKEEEAPK